MATASKDIDKARKRISSDFSALATHAEDLLKATASASGDGVDKARAQLKDSLQTIRTQLESVESAAIDQGKAAINATSEMVRDKPWQTIAIAVAVGVVVGCLTSHSVSRR